MTKQFCTEGKEAVFDSSSVEIVGIEQYHGSLEVARYMCNVCRRAGLVQLETVLGADNPIDLAHELRRANFCDTAISVAPVNISPRAVLSGADSVVQ